MAAPFEVVVSGHLCLDLIPQMGNVAPPSLALPGRLLEVGAMQMATGGPVSNAGLALHRLGVRVGLMSRVGDDWLGQATIDYLRQRDPALCSLITVQAGEPSSYSVVLAPGGADRTFLHCTGTNSTFNAESVDYDLLRGTKLFHLGYPPLLPGLLVNDGEGLSEIFRRVKALGVVTSMDMVVPDPNGTGRSDWKTILQKTLPYVDIFLPSIDEILFMLRRDDWRRWQGDTLHHISAAYLDNLADELLAMGAVVVGFKLGEYGLYLRTAPAEAFARLAVLGLRVEEWANVTLWQPAFMVEVRGTTGAGDSAYAGFLTALLNQQSPTDALRWACAVGACNVEAVDSNSGVQDLPTTLARLSADWAVRMESLHGYGT